MRFGKIGSVFLVTGIVAGVFLLLGLWDALT